MPFSRLLNTLLLVIAAGSASAHEFWIEPTKGQLQVFLGEYADNAREQSPGMLDKMTKPRAQLQSSTGHKPLDVTRSPTALLIAQVPAQGESVVFEETAYPLFDGEHDGKKVKAAWFPAARYIADSGAQAPLLKLDIVPTAVDGEFAVSFAGKPLASAEVEIVMPAGWKRIVHTDAAGLIKPALPWQGSYLLAVSHTDASGGKLAGQRYRVAYYGTTLSLVRTAGLPALPAQPASKPTH